MSKFKVGDKVRCKKTSKENHVTEGKIYKVLGLESGYDEYVLIKNNRGQEAFVFTFRFDLAEDTSDLEELVRKANEGAEAAERLIKLHGAVLECRDIEHRSQWGPALGSGGFTGLIFRIKPKKPAFESFTTSNGWKVKIESSRLYIGCQEFPIKGLKKALSELFDLQNSSAVVEGMTTNYNCIRLVREGIRYLDHVLQWPDAERIYEALKKMDGGK